MECLRKQARQHYKDNKTTRVAQAVANTARVREMNQELYCQYLESHPCSDCGNTDIIVLEADHLRDKKYSVPTMIRNGYAWRRILEELAKCEIVCRNCHARRTHGRLEGGSYKTRYVEKILEPSP